MAGDPTARNTVVRLAAVHKTYRLYDHPSARLRELFTGKPRHTAFQALRDISFTVGRGETVGVVGENGSGKSTLLKLIAGVVKPTAGTLTRHGRVSAVLELGAGFDPEFSGRSNARLNSAIMGFSPRQVEERLERIEAFAEIGEFMDRPVKTYSTGMLARLAFACAVHLDPDILLVDEALAVGDMFFQAKCMAHMRHMIEEQGTTLLFVSHDTVAVTQLCTKALYLEQGRNKAWGQALEVTDAYRRDVQLKLSRRVSELSPAVVTPPTPGQRGHSPSHPRCSRRSRLSQFSRLVRPPRCSRFPCFPSFPRLSRCPGRPAPGRGRLSGRRHLGSASGPGPLRPGPGQISQRGGHRRRRESSKLL